MRVPRNWPSYLAGLHESGLLSAVALVRVSDVTILPPRAYGAGRGETARALHEKVHALYESEYPEQARALRERTICHWRACGAVTHTLFGTPASSQISWSGHDQHGVGPLPNGPAPELGSAFAAYRWAKGEVMALPLAMALEADPIVRQWHAESISAA